MSGICRTGPAVADRRRFRPENAHLGVLDRRPNQRFFSLGCSVLGHQGSLEGNWVHPPIWIYNFLFASSLHARLRNISLSTLYGAVPILFSGHIIIRPDKGNNTKRTPN